MDSKKTSTFGMTFVQRHSKSIEEVLNTIQPEPLSMYSDTIQQLLRMDHSGKLAIIVHLI
jgi:hypothetical protein